MPPQNRPDQPPLCHLANWHSIGVWWVVLLYLMRTTSTNGGRVSLLNNTSPRNLPKNNNNKKKEKRIGHHPDPLNHPLQIRYDYLFSFALGNFIL
jgi:hypothetical protein